MTTRFVLIRHGETDANVRGLYHGIIDTSLSDRGREQVAALAASMRGTSPDVMVSSPLLRALDTAKVVAGVIGMPARKILVDERLIERNYGVAEGLTVDERLARWPGAVWDGLETRDVLEARVTRTLDNLCARHPDQELWLFTHGKWIESALESVSGGRIHRDDVHIVNTSRTILSHDEGGWKVGGVALADHLETT